MEKYMNNKVIDEINNLVNSIKESSIYKEYKDLELKISKNEEIKKLTDEIKSINKKLVKTPSIELENKLKELEEELNNIPLYIEYKEKVEELNNLLLVIKNKMDNFINEILIN